MALTDQELLLLDNFMYLKGSMNTDNRYETLGDIVDEYLENPRKLVLDGCDTEEQLEQYTKILEEMKESDSLMALGLGEVTEQGSDELIRGRCFVEYGEDGEVAGHVVAFRGTGGAAVAWRDNFEGLYKVETEAQRLAKEFVQGLGVDDITVTGHSKGGNLAMYVTAMCGDQIDRCVSYDGQGFGKNFLDTLSESQLAEISAKIKSVSSHNDFVNILLTSIAGQTYYVANEGEGLEGRHSAYPMYEYNEAALDGNGGMFTDAIAENRDYTMSLAHYGLEAFLISCPEDERNLIADVAGNVVAQLVGNNTELEETKADIAADWNKYKAEKKEDFNESVDYVEDKLVGAKDSLAEFGGSVLESGKEIGGGLAGLGIGTWGFLKNTGSGLSGLGENFMEGLGELSDGNIMEGLGEFGEGFADLGSNLWDGAQELGGGLLDLGEGLMDGAKEFGEGVVEFGGDIVDGAIDIGGDIVDGAKELGEKAWSLAENAAEGTWEIVTDLGEDIADLGKKAANFLGFGR